MFVPIHIYIYTHIYMQTYHTRNITHTFVFVCVLFGCVSRVMQFQRDFLFLSTMSRAAHNYVRPATVSGELLTGCGSMRTALVGPSMPQFIVRSPVEKSFSPSSAARPTRLSRCTMAPIARAHNSTAPTDASTERARGIPHCA